MKLYFLDDGSLIISEIEEHPKCITLVKTEDVEIERTVGCHYLSGLSGKEAYDLLVGQNFSLDKNDLSNSEKSVGTGDKKIE